MNNTLKQLKRITKLKRLTKTFLLTGLLLLIGVTAKGQVINSNYGYVIFYNNYYLPSSTTGTTTFNPNTCIWFGTSGQSFTNGAGYYLYRSSGNNFSVINSGTAQTGWTINGSENGTTGARLYYDAGTDRYMYLNNTTWGVNGNNTTEANRYCLFSITKYTYAATGTAATISGPTTISATGTSAATYTRSANANGTAGYIDYKFYNNTSHLRNAADNSNLTSAPTPTAITSSSAYTWSLEGISSTYAEINSSTGVVNYKTYVPSDQTATVKLTATYEGLSLVASYSVTFEAVKQDPTSLSITSANPMTVYVGNTGNITYSLTPDPCYDNVSFSSASTATATVNGSGVVTGVATGTTTITVIARKIDNTTTSDLTKTVNVTVKDKVATPVISFTPNPSDNTKATATITCATSGTTIYYTIDDSDDPTSSDLNYTTTGSFTVNEHQVVKAIAIKTTDGTYWDNSDVASGTYVSCSTNDPAITYVQSSGGATVTISAEAGATIYYTTNGNDPTSNSSHGTAPVTIENVSNGTTVKAYAKNGTCQASSIVSKEIITSGVSNGVVTLYDYEDHNWSYYQASSNLPDGYPTYLSSPDPRNVKITYRGGSVSGASSVAISALDGEGQNEMVYYKTLEKSVPGMTGDYPYTVISNPFSKRPATGSGSSKTYYGFAGWKVISGGNYISEYSDGQTLPLDATIHFTNLNNNYTPNCTSGEIVFEATWTTATVKTGSSAQTFTGGTYETNFWVLSGNNNIGNLTITGNCTMSARYPDGTVNFTRNLTGTITAGGNNAKVEFVNMNSTGNVDAAGYTFTMGRGIVNSGNGGQLSASSSQKNTIHTVKIESGKYASLYHFTTTIGSSYDIDQLVILGCDYDRARIDNSKLTITGSMYLANATSINRTSGVLFARSIIKSGTFQETVSGTYSGTAAQSYYFGCYGSNNRSAGHRYMLVEGGNIRGLCGGTDHTTNQNANDPAFTLRVRGSENNPVINGIIYGAAENALCQGRRVLVFTGGTIKGWIAGAANGTDQSNGILTGATFVYVGGNTQVNSNGSNTVINRAVGGNVFAAGCGYNASSNSGQVTLGTNLVISDEAYVERGVYGGGSYGFCSTNQTANLFILGGTVDGKSGGVSGTAYSASITGGVFGGACQNKGGIVNIYMDGGLVNTGVHGGSNASGTITGPVTMQINGGQVGTTAATANIHGGGYGQSTTVSGNVEINLGTCGATDGVTVYGDVYGGSALGTVNTNSSNTTKVNLYKGTIYGGLYGGGLGSSTVAAAVNGAVSVKVFGGSVLCSDNDREGEAGTGSVFGCNNVNGAPQSTVTVDIYGTDQPASGYALHAVYGGGNKAAYDDTPVVTIHGCSNSIDYVYGGGNATDVRGTNVTIWGGNIGNAFGGGNGFSETNNHTNASAAHYNPGANITASGTQLKIYGGTIGAAFGGSNQYGTINNTIAVTVEAKTESGNDPCSGDAYTSCPMNIRELYGGGNRAPIQTSGNVWIVPTVSLDCSAKIGMLFGGAKAADYGLGIDLVVEGGTFEKVFGGNNEGGTISGNVSVTFKGGTAGAVYGGCNKDGTINGTLQVTIDSTYNADCNYFHVGDVYGGGDLAAYTAPTATPNYPVVNIINGTINGSVYGGGKGSTATVTGNPIVTIGDNTNAAKYVIVKGNVYGGGDAAPVSGSTSVTYNDTNSKSKVDKLFGGGNQASVSSTASVTLTSGKVKSGIYGGCNLEGGVTGNVTVDINGGTVGTSSTPANVHGGGYGVETFTGSNVTVTINNASTETAIYGDVYGGSALGNVNSTNGSDITKVWLKQGIISGSLYGGGLGSGAPDNCYASVNGDVQVIVDDGSVTNVFGANNVNGSPQRTVSVTINNNDGVIEKVFGGGNKARYTATASVTNAGTPIVLINNGTIDNVYGGGNEAGTSGGTQVTLNGGTINHGLYGGCNTSGGVDKDINVYVYGGTVGSSSTAANIHGGGYGSGTSSGGNVTVTLGNGGEGPVIWGDIYGGSALGNVNDAENANLTTKVWLKKGTVNGSLYGGGLGDDSHPALVNGNVEVVIDGGSIKKTGTNPASVFGCNNVNGTPKRNVTVTVNASEATTYDGEGHKVYAINGVYGGGNLAHYDPTTPGNYPTVTINGCETSIKDVYGGGNAAAVPYTKVTINGGDIDRVFGGGNGESGTPAHVGYKNKEDGSTANPYSADGNVNVDIKGGTVNQVFGGSNAHGSIKGAIAIGINQDGTCPLNLGEVFGGGNMTSGPAGEITIGCTGDQTIDYIYGGANQADVTGDIVLNIKGGRFNNVYGGNNISGNISGTIIVNVDWQGDCDNYLGNVFGGGNLAPYTAPTATPNYPQVNIKNGVVSGSVYGGGNGDPNSTTQEPGSVEGNPQVTIGIEDEARRAIVRGNVYGGGNSAKVTGDTFIELKYKSKVLGNVYGGGNMAPVSGDTKVIVNGK